MTATDHTQDNCDRPYKGNIKKVGRAHYICSICNRDVSFEYVYLMEAMQALERK